MEPSRLLGRASVAGLALCLVALMILSVPSGTAMGISSAASTGVAAPANAYAPDAYMPDPQA
ncbi:MAG: hypothetical protein KGI89_14955, partial [Euryarchaeota archaeon]|nr:hypothetical protein [Euryarchaeota archaeon]